MYTTKPSFVKIRSLFSYRHDLGFKRRFFGTSCKDRIEVNLHQLDKLGSGVTSALAVLHIPPWLGLQSLVSENWGTLCEDTIRMR